ncbi:dUTP diphosphatase [Paenibacillus turpanensis]|uniref:dUTP diphosphatase n=1 Tax=Paenibacillus turpanensis TaxID=2689078 RepID=UPI00313325CA
MSLSFEVFVQRLPNAAGLPLPAKMTEQAAGYDLYAAVEEPVKLLPGERQLIPTGLALAMPDRLEAQIRPRSGLAFKHGITTLNSPGTIDADYRGEVKVLLINHGQEPFIIERGERIAQMVFGVVPTTVLIEVEELEATVRGASGFGSTGTK